MRVCMITSLHSPKDDRIFFKEAISLKERGIEVNILCVGNNSGEIKDMAGKTLNRDSSESIRINGIDIHYVAKKSGIIQKLLYKIGMGFSWNSFIQKAIDINAEVYHAHEPQTAYIGLKIQKKTGAKLIYDAHEPWIFSRSIKEWVLKKICLPKLTNVITANTITEESFLKNNPNLNTTVIYNCSPNFFNDYKIENQKPIVCHEGALWFNRGLRLIIKALVILKQSYPDFRFRIIGDVYGKEKKFLNDKIKLHNLEENIEITGWLAYEDVPKNIADCGIGIITNTDEKRNTMAGPPNKLFNYITMGLAVISTDLLATTQIIEETKCGIILEKRDENILASELQKLIKDSRKRKEFQVNSRDWAIKKYNWDSEADKLFNFYKGLK